MRGRESNLLDLGKVVLDVLVQCHLAEGSERHFLLRPDFREVKDIPAELFGLLGRQHLYEDAPRGVVAILDGVEKVLSVPIGVLRCQLGGFVTVEGLAALVGLQVHLHIVKGAIGLHPFVCMA